MQPRKRLIHYNPAGQPHELTFSCHNRLPLLSRNLTREWTAEAISKACIKHDYALLAFVIMPEHLHLIVLPRETDYKISWLLKSIKQPVARKAGNWLKQNNPVRRGLSETPADWKWSSAA